VERLGDVLIERKFKEVEEAGGKALVSFQVLFFL
jgi:hypothetical protein